MLCYSNGTDNYYRINLLEITNTARLRLQNTKTATTSQQYSSCS